MALWKLDYISDNFTRYIPYNVSFFMLLHLFGYFGNYCHPINSMATIYDIINAIRKIVGLNGPGLYTIVQFTKIW